MRIRLFFIVIIFMYFGCENEKRPNLPSEYLQPFYSEIKKIDSTAKVLSFISGEGRFAFIDDFLGPGTYEVRPIKLNGEVKRVTEHDYEVTAHFFDDSVLLKENTTTQYVFSDRQVIEKKFKDPEENVIYKAVYKKNLIYLVTAIYKQHNDSARIRFLYDNGKIKKKQVFSSVGSLDLAFDFYYNNNENPDYKYTIVKSKSDVFDKFEFNNKLGQAIMSHFDTSGKLKWLLYIEYDNKGNRIYEETFNKTYVNPVFRKTEYSYNQYEEMTALKTEFPRSKTKKNYGFRYTKRDSMNNWIERKTFEDDKIFMITKRDIKYSNKKL